MATPERDPDPPSTTAEPYDDPMLYCPRCSQKLLSHKCKLVCTRCGYYMSCADYY